MAAPVSPTNTTANLIATMKAAADEQAQIAAATATTSTEIAKSQAIQKAYEKIQG